MTIITVIVFILIGVVIGFLASLAFNQDNKIISPIVGAVGSVGLALLARLIGLGAGVLSFSLWGIVAAILGACLLSGIYGLISKKINP